MMEDQLSTLCKEWDELAKRVEILRPKDPTEEGTKLALVQPFFTSLGYELADPSVCVPEYKAGWATDDEDKVDYALFDGNGDPMILVECKRLREKLHIKSASQMAKYFANTDAGVGILTNGNEYEIYLDIVKANVMDEKPFFQFNLTDSDDVDRRVIARLSLQSDGSVDLEGLKDEVREWEIEKKYKPRAMDVFKGWLTRADEELVRLLEKRLEAPEGSLGELVQGWFAEFTGCKKDLNGPLPPPPPGNIRPLTEWNIHKKKDMPVRIILPDGTDHRINPAHDVPVETTKWLIQNGHLTRNSLPVRYAGRYIVSETDTHPNEQSMISPQEAEWAYVEGNYSPKDHVRNAKIIIEHVGQDPAKFKGQFPDMEVRQP